MLFGEAPISPKELVRKLIAEIQQHDGGNTWRHGENTPWTRAVKIGLRNIAERLPSAPICVYTDFAPGAREFLLDIVWWTKGCGEGASLACECEWHFAGRGKAETKTSKSSWCSRHR
jgi:hypothetical protein